MVSNVYVQKINKNDYYYEYKSLYHGFVASNPIRNQFYLEPFISVIDYGNVDTTWLSLDFQYPRGSHAQHLNCESLFSSYRGFTHKPSPGLDATRFRIV